MSDQGSKTAKELPKFVGKYRIVRMIARSNDIVYEAVDPNLGRHVALKELVLAPGISGAGRRERIERFQREAKAAGALKHPNIVTIYEVGQHLDHRFIAMEYLDGQTLRERINLVGPLPVKEAIGITLQLCDALGYAHTQGVVHRDVKPDNIHIVPPNTTVKLTDFGIARVLSEPAITSIGQIFGTPSYMSPEQLTSRLVDHRTDIFSTAVVIFEMLTGKKPFRGESVVAVTYQIMNTEVHLPPTIPPGIAAILERAFKKDPDLRYQNMRSLASDLRHELAFADSPYYVAPIAAPEPAAMTLAMNASEIGALVDGAPAPTEGTVAVPTLAPVRTSESTGMPLTSAEDALGLQRAILRLSAISAAMLLLCCVTLWGIGQFAQRLKENIRYAAAMNSYIAANQNARLGNIDMALTEYRAAMQSGRRADALNDRARRGVSECLTVQGTRAEAQGNWSSAMQSFLSAITIDDSDPIAHFDLAALYNAKGDEPNALREYAQAHSIAPQSPEGTQAMGLALSGYLQLGNQQSSAGDTNSARQSWQQVIELDPNSEQAEEARSRLGDGG